MNYTEVEGWFESECDYFFTNALTYLTKVFGKLRYVELGTFAGKSCIYMLQKKRDLNLDLDIETVDHFSELEPWYKLNSSAGSESSQYYEKFVSNLEKCGFSLGDVKVHRKFTIDAANDFENQTIHFLYIDACHEYEAVKSDIKSWKSKVVNKGILSGHDYHHETVSRAVKELIPNHVSIGNCWYSVVGEINQNIVA